MDDDVKRELAKLRTEIDKVRGYVSQYTTGHQFEAAISGTIVTAKLTAGGANGSITVLSGRVTNFVPAT